MSVKEDLNKHRRERIKASLTRKEKNTKQSVVEKSNTTTQKKHIFYIKVDGVCDAKGYYNEELKFFFVCKDSLVSHVTDLTYLINDKENARGNFLKKICEEYKGYYRVIRDAKCRSAYAAACYVLGREAYIDRWVDSKGKHLTDVYPSIFNEFYFENTTNTHEIEEKPKRQRMPKYFFIIRDKMGKRSCYAKGSYNKTSKSFTIIKDSELSLDVSKSYLYTASDIKRRMIIKKQCLQSKIGYRLVNDLVCKSPEEAACYVLGDFVTGWDEWRSKEGVPLDNYIDRSK